MDETKAVRVIYRKSNSRVVWRYSMDSPSDALLRCEWEALTSDEKLDILGCLPREESELEWDALTKEEKTTHKLVEFPMDIELYLGQLVTRGIIGDDGLPIDGSPDDYAIVEGNNRDKAIAILASDENLIVDGEVIIGARRPIREPTPPRNPLAEIDELKAKIAQLEDR